MNINMEWVLTYNTSHIYNRIILIEEKVERILNKNPDITLLGIFKCCFIEEPLFKDDYIFHSYIYQIFKNCKSKIYCEEQDICDTYVLYYYYKTLYHRGIEMPICIKKPHYSLETAIQSMIVDYLNSQASLTYTYDEILKHFSKHSEWFLNNPLFDSIIKSSPYKSN